MQLGAKGMRDGMRLVLRTFGTWLVALAMVLLVIDGTKSLAGGALTFTSLDQTWTQLHAGSLEAVRTFLESRFFAAFLAQVMNAVLAAPAFAVVAVPGLLLALAGRKRRTERFVGQEFI